MSDLSAPLWDRARAGRGTFPILDAPLEADLLVVGLGASGLAAVQHATERGLTVAGIDSGVVGAGAAGRNAGFALAGIAPFHHDAVGLVGRERAVALYRATLDELAGNPPLTFVPTGSLRIAGSDRELDDCRDQLAAMEADGLPVEWYAGPEGEGLLFPHDGVIQPAARCLAMAGSVAAMGARLFERTPWPTELITARATVVAIDGALDTVLPELAGRVRTTRLQVLATEPLPGPRRYPRPVYRRYGYDYWQQLDTGEIVVGGCRDLFVDDEWDPEDHQPTPKVQAAIEALLRAVVVPDIEVDVVARWAGRVGYTADGLPVVEEVRPGVIACGAYSGTGNVVGVLAARAAVDLAIDGRSDSPLVTA